ncbi:Basic 7S globulin [Hordeum vulgare]|nr:Basic 7S globulin [Hordeum vulgare]
MLCLPSNGRTGFNIDGVGAAIFAGCAFFLVPLADRLSIRMLGVPLWQPFARNPDYFVTGPPATASPSTKRVATSDVVVVGLSTTMSNCNVCSTINMLPPFTHGELSGSGVMGDCAYQL